MPIAPRLSLAALAIVVAGPVSAQDLLTRDQVELLMQENVFCYYPSDRTACSWAELYTEFEADHVIMYSASAVWQDPMEVVEFRVDWRGDALCVPYESQGVLSAYQAEGYRFPFSLEGLDPMAEERLPELIANFGEGAPREFCFQYSNDPDIPGQLLQHVFREGVEDEERDPVSLVPRWASGIAINPSG